MNPVLWLSAFNSLWVILLFLPANGLRMRITAPSALLAASYAAMCFGCTICAQLAMRRGPVMAVTLFMLTGGLIIPSAYGVLFLQERLSALKWAGMAVILISFFPGTLLSGKKGKKSGVSPPLKSDSVFLLLCFAVFLCNGLVSVITKVHSIREHAVSERDFLLFAACVQIIFALAGTLLSAFTGKDKKFSAAVWFSDVGRGAFPKSLRLPVLLAGGYTVCNYAANVCSMEAARTLDSSLQFSIISAAVILLTAFMAWAVFKEKPKKLEWFGLSLTAAGFLLMVLG